MRTQLAMLRLVSHHRFTLTCSAASGDWKQAIEDAQATLAYDPLSVPAWFRFGISLAGAELFEEAVEALETALELQPGCANKRCCLA